MTIRVVGRQPHHRGACLSAALQPFSIGRFFSSYLLVHLVVFGQENPRPADRSHDLHRVGPLRPRSREGRPQPLTPSEDVHHGIHQARLADRLHQEPSNPDFAGCPIDLLRVELRGCSQKGSLLFAEYLDKHLLLALPHRQFVFTLPKALRVFLRYDQRLFGPISRLIFSMMTQFHSTACGRPITTAAVVSFPVRDTARLAQLLRRG